MFQCHGLKFTEGLVLKTTNMATFLALLSICVVYTRSQQCASKINSNQSISKPSQFTKSIQNSWNNCPLWVAKNDSSKISKTDGVRIDLNANHPNAGLVKHVYTLHSQNILNQSALMEAHL